MQSLKRLSRILGSCFGFSKKISWNEFGYLVICFIYSVWYLLEYILTVLFNIIHHKKTNTSYFNINFRVEDGRNDHLK